MCTKSTSKPIQSTEDNAIFGEGLRGSKYCVEGLITEDAELIPKEGTEKRGANFRVKISVFSVGIPSVVSAIKGSTCELSYEIPTAEGRFYFTDTCSK